MSKDHNAVTQSQFGPRASDYVTSAVHAAGVDLERLERIAARTLPRRAMDLGCGGGHVAYRLARHARAVVAADLSADMLAAVSATARERGLTNIQTCEAPAERLPFEGGAFDLLACRFSAHHWRHFSGGIAEAHRVTQSGAPAVFIDAVAPEQPLLDTHLQAVELLRDGSHVRDYSTAEWTQTLERAGFNVQALHRYRLRIDFATWIARMRTPAALASAIRTLQSSASREVAEYFAIEPDGSFQLDVAVLEAVA